jgi:hypothetical protein
MTAKLKTKRKLSEREREQKLPLVGQKVIRKVSHTQPQAQARQIHTLTATVMTTSY